MRPDRSKQCSLSAVLYAYLHICICVTNCDLLSADIYCVFWAACEDTVHALSPAFSRANGLGKKFVFLQVLVTGIVTNRASNRLKYCSDLGSANFFCGLPPVQDFRRLILKIHFRLKLKILKIIVIGFRFAEAKI